MHSGCFPSIDTWVDLTAALRELNVPLDAKRLVLGLYRDPMGSKADVGQFLGWDAKRLDSVTRSLDPDRKHGRNLRRRLVAYLPPDDRQNIL